MSAKMTMLSVALLAIVGGILAGIILGRPSSQPLTTPAIPTAPRQASVETPPAPQIQEIAKPAAVIPAAETDSPVETAKPETTPNAKSQNNPPASKPPKKPKQLVDPVAKMALGLVGMDRDAEAYWLGAIYDTTLPDNEREDLMEDLNEDGLSDPKNPGPQDLPLIMNRLAIIEEIVPYADEFMLRHLGEAYKDLINLAERTQGGGRPVR